MKFFILITSGVKIPEEIDLNFLISEINYNIFVNSIKCGTRTFHHKNKVGITKWKKSLLRWCEIYFKKNKWKFLLQCKTKHWNQLSLIKLRLLRSDITSAWRIVNFGPPRSHYNIGYEHFFRINGKLSTLVTSELRCMINQEEIRMSSWRTQFKKNTSL